MLTSPIFSTNLHHIYMPSHLSRHTTAASPKGAGLRTLQIGVIGVSFGRALTMAVLDAVPGIEVTVKVGGRNAIEYDDPHGSESAARTDTECCIVSKYIESFDDTAFYIKATIDNDVYRWDDIEHVLGVCVDIDGQPAISVIAEEGRPNLRVRGIKAYSQEYRKWVLKTFRFSAVTIVDSCNMARVKKDAKDVKNLGLIEVSFTREVKKGLHKSKRVQPPDLNTHDVAEKALKGKSVSHSMTLGDDEILGSHHHLWHTERIREDEGPIAIFRFLYRSREGLKQELVIPRTPSPEPSSPVSRSVGNMSIAALHRLAQERLDQIKAGEEEGADKSSIKRERDEVIDLEAPPAKRTAVIIDLTDD